MCIKLCIKPSFIVSSKNKNINVNYTRFIHCYTSIESQKTIINIITIKFIHGQKIMLKTKQWSMLLGIVNLNIG